MSQPTNYDATSSQSTEIPFARQVVTIRPVTRLKIKEKPFCFFAFDDRSFFSCKKIWKHNKKRKKRNCFNSWPWQERFQVQEQRNKLLKNNTSPKNVAGFRTKKQMRTLFKLICSVDDSFLATLSSLWFIIKWLVYF